MMRLTPACFAASKTLAVAITLSGIEQVPADVGGVARLGGEMHYDVLALECGGDGLKVGEVGGEGVQAVEGYAVDAAELVLVAEVVA